jgi:eukaryotic-like serine/threonine-protein kinase
MFSTGDSLGPYTIVRRLGGGAMGEVFQARHRHMARDVAIKVLKAELSQDADVVNRFFTEARATAAVRHAGIVEIFDCDLHRSGRAFIVMEYLVGEDLAHRLARAGGFVGDLPTLRSIGRQLASALAAAHGVGIVHRDLKPENVFLVGQGAPTVKVVDFGIAKLLFADGDHSQTRTGNILGTPLYMSPEQARGAKTIDHRADIYALGCVLFEMLTGRPPFMRKGPAEVIVAHLHEPAPRASSLEASVPSALDDLVASMMAKAPDDRPPTMTDVLARLAEPAASGAGSGRVLTKLLPGGSPSASSGLPGAAPSLAAGAPAAGAAAPAPAAAPAAARPPLAVAAAKPQVRVGGAASAPTRAGFAGREAQVHGRAGETTLGSSAAELVATAGDEAPGRMGRRGLVIVVGVGVAGAVAVMGGVALQLARSGGRAASEARAPISAPVTAPSIAPPAPPSPPSPPSAPAAQPVTAEVEITVSSRPSGAEVWIGGEASPRGRTPLAIKLSAGAPPAPAVLRAAGRGALSVTLDPKDTSPRTFVLPAGAPTPVRTGTPHHHRRTNDGAGEFKAIED